MIQLEGWCQHHQDPSSASASLGLKPGCLYSEAAELADQGPALLFAPADIFLKVT